MIVDGATIGRDASVVTRVCVIGSGTGGAVVAKELAEAGVEVVLLEERAFYTGKDFTGRPHDTTHGPLGLLSVRLLSVVARVSRWSGRRSGAQRLGRWRNSFSKALNRLPICGSRLRFSSTMRTAYITVE